MRRQSAAKTSVCRKEYLKPVSAARFYFFIHVSLMQSCFYSGLCFHFSSLKTQFQKDKLSVDLHNVNKYPIVVFPDWPFGCGAVTMLPVHLLSCLYLRNLYEHMQRGCSLVPF